MRNENCTKSVQHLVFLNEHFHKVCGILDFEGLQVRVKKIKIHKLLILFINIYYRLSL